MPIINHMGSSQSKRSLAHLRSAQLKPRAAANACLKNSNGFSLVEIMIVTGIMGIMMLAMSTMQSNQMKANNYLEFQLKRTQLQGTIIGQILKDPNNCACLFNGASAFPSSGIATLAGATPTQIGPYTSAAPGCGAPAQFFIDGVGIDGLKATSIQLQNITPTANPNIYTGQLNLDIQSTKEVMGPKNLPISIPVSIATSPAGANVNFVSCSTGAASAGGISGSHCRLVHEIFENNNCTGKTSLRYSDWFDNVPAGGIAWTSRNAAGAFQASRNGFNWMTADVSCSRVGIQCQ